MLQKSVPKYNGTTGESRLFVEFQEPLGKLYADDPQYKEELAGIILAQTGKTVDVEMLVANQHSHTNLVQVSVDQAIRENIHMEVVIEEEHH